MAERGEAAELAALRDQLAQITELLELAPAAIIVRELESSRIRFWNRGAEELYGWTREEALGQVTHTLLATTFSVSREAVDAALRERGFWEGELSHARRDGTRVPVASRQAVQRDPAGRPVATLEINTDITDRREAERERERRIREQAALERTTRLQALTSALSATASAEQVTEVAVTDAVAALGACAGVIALLSPDEGSLELAGQAGYSAERVLPWRRFSVSTQVPLADAVRAGEIVLVRSPEEWAAHYASLGWSPAGSRAQAWAAVPLVVDRRAMGALGLTWPEPRQFEDADRTFMAAVGQQVAVALERAGLVEAERRARAAAEEAVRLHDEFLAVVSHDLRAPLAAIRARAQLVRRRALSGRAADVEPSMRMIEASAAQMSAQIDELVDLARLKAGQPLALELVDVDMIALVRAAIEELAYDTERHPIQLTTDLASLAGTGDPVRLKRVLTNLLSNAIKYSPDGGPISVQVEGGDDWAAIHVQDQGLGIPAADVPYIFERFRRGSNVVGRIPGEGLGLAGARQVVEQHGGTLQVHSTEQLGSTFTVRLPLRPG
jgi:PAS domain S-box-containing protein